MVRILFSLLLLLTCLDTAAAPWRLVRSDPERDIRVFVQGDPAQPYQHFYVQARMQAPLGAVLAVFNDVPAAPEWVARVEQARLLRRQGDQSWIYTVYQLPYPFLARDAVLHTVLSRDASGVVTLDSHAVPGLIEARPRSVRLLDAHSTWKFTPQPGGWLQVELWGEGNPGGYIPSWLYNYSLPDGPVQTLRNLRRMVQRQRYLTPVRPAVSAKSAR